MEGRADVFTATKDGETLLHRAADFGHVDVVRLLLDEGVGIAVQTRFGKTAMQLAASRGHQSIVLLLLDNGADPQELTEMELKKAAETRKAISLQDYQFQILLLEQQNKKRLLKKAAK